MRGYYSILMQKLRDLKRDIKRKKVGLSRLESNMVQFTGHKMLALLNRLQYRDDVLNRLVAQHVFQNYLKLLVVGLAEL